MIRPTLSWLALMSLLLVACGSSSSSGGEADPASLASKPAPPLLPNWTASAQPLQPSPGSLPDVLIIILDTTSLEAVTSFMPKTEAFRRAAGVRDYTQAWSPSNSTMETVAGVFTGTWMSHAQLWEDGYETLPELLASRGYSTLIASANPVLDHPFFERGFERAYLKPETIDREFPDRGVLQHVRNDWAAMAGPKMAWLQLAACHDYQLSGKSYMDAPPTTAEGLEEAWRAYGLDCTRTDSLLPDLLALNPGGLTVITADHGELFGDRGAYALPDQAPHGHGVSDSPMELHVPLLLRGPGVVAGQDPEPVSILDVRSTVLRLAGLETPGGNLLDGTGLRPVAAAACDIHDDQTHGLSVVRTRAGEHIVRSYGIPKVPELFQWNPRQKVGLQSHQKRARASLSPTELQLLEEDARLVCVDDRDLCRAHPELSSLGYVDCSN